MSPKIACITVLLALLLPGIANAEGCKQSLKLGLVSGDKVVLQDYCDDKVALIIEYTGVPKVAGFEKCKVEKIITFALTCAGMEPVRHGYHIGPRCRYVVFTSQGLGLDKRETWVAWAEAADACDDFAEAASDRRFIASRFDSQR